MGEAMTQAEFRSALKSLGLSQRSLAERLGVEASTVNRWALGKAPVPKYAVYVLSLLAERQELEAAALVMLRRHA
jgi:transcriptional regulator with XRE-family HTH domain